MQKVFAEKLEGTEEYGSRKVQTYVCPDCKAPLDKWKCASCGEQFSSQDGIPILLSRDPRLGSGAQIGMVYDDIYATRAGVWVDQGRTPEFITYFFSLLAKLSSGRILEVGCGEGFLISAIRADEKFAIDLSLEALRKASGRAQAEYCVALAERLPYSADFFDLLLSVGVMEHFIDDRMATREIHRVLRPGGHYVVLIHVATSASEGISQKFREYVYPRPRLFALAKWLYRKVINPIRQPIQRPYTRQSAQACLEECGFAVEEIISNRSHPDLPLVGPHVLIYVTRKR
jgi:SAM-dependent methyltransferase